MKNFTETQERIANKCDELKALLLEKNRKYGNSALEKAIGTMIRLILALQKHRECTQHV